MATREDHFFPPVGAPESDILRYRDRRINRWSLHRNMHIGRIALSIWYYLSKQNASFDLEASFDGVRGAVLRDLDTSDLPKPITNYVDPAIEQEIISLIKHEWIPKVYPKSNEPSIKAAAQVAEDLLNYKLEKLHWPEKRHMHALYFAVGGTGLIQTAWDQSYNELKTIGAPGAVWCDTATGGCGTALYSADVPDDLISGGIGGRPTAWANNARPVDDGEGSAALSQPMSTLSHCPTCHDTARSLTPYSPPPEVAATGDDPFKRPLGVQVPRGDCRMEILLQSEFHPWNGGIRVAPYDLAGWARRSIRSMEWWEEHAPHVVDEISPDAISDLLYDDPLLGTWSVLGSWSSAYDSGILDNHANADELIEQPTFRHPLGRYVLCSKTKVIIDEDLLLPADVNGETLYVPRVQMSSARFKIRPGEFWGTTLPDAIISPQNRLNAIDANTIEMRQRMGPYIVAPSDVWFEGAAMEVPGLGKMLQLRESISNPEWQFSSGSVFQGPMMGPEGFKERDIAKSDIQTLAGPNSASLGQATPNVGATSAMELMVQQDEQSRMLREQELVRSQENAWSHLLRQQWLLRTEEDEYEVLGPDSSWRLEQYKGDALRGQTEVTLERQPYISHSVMTREAAREGMADGLIVNDSPVARRKILEMYGLPTDVNQDTNNQIDQAERYQVDFQQKGIVPTQDPLDDPGVHFRVFSTFLKSEDGKSMADEAGWDDILRAIAGWEDELQQIEMLEQMSMQFYGGRLRGAEADKAYANAMIAYDQQKGDYAQQMQIHGAMANAGPAIDAKGVPMPPQSMAPLPPQPPPQIPQIPVLLQDRVLLVWSKMMGEMGVGPQAQQQAPGANLTRDPSIYIKFRALTAAYNLTALKAAATMTLGAQPGPAAGQSGKPPSPPQVASTPEGGAH